VTAPIRGRTAADLVTTLGSQESFMAKLIELHEAAKMLGISPEQLTDMRSRNAIFGYRDGSTWKFKVEEIERVKAELASSAEQLGGEQVAEDLDELVDVGDLSLDDEGPEIDLEFDRDASADEDADVIEMAAEGDDSDSILVSEEELGQSDENTASTIIGEPDALLPQDSSLGGSDALAGTSDLELSLEESDAIAASDIFDDDTSRPVSASDTANLKPAGSSDVGDDLKLQDSGSLELSLEDTNVGGSRIELADDAQASSSGFGSAIDLGLDDDELVLGSGAGSDVTAGAGDSGISLGNPSDSGLSLEEPLELSSGSGVESLELGEDEMLDLDESMGGGVEADDDFMLTPVEEGLDEESDSGSQVIALDNEDFGESAVEMLTEEDEAAGLGAAEFIEEEEEGVGIAALAPTTSRAEMAAVAAGEAEEGTYSIWNVLSLFSIVLLLGFTGILMLDLINNMWSWEKNLPFNSTIMDAILDMMP
jgi:hypothetical protein